MAVGEGATLPGPFWHPRQLKFEAAGSSLFTQCEKGFHVINAPRSYWYHFSCCAEGATMLLEWCGGSGLGPGGVGEGDGGGSGGSGLVPLLPAMQWLQRVGIVLTGCVPCNQQPCPTLPELSVHVQQPGVLWHQVQQAATVEIFVSWARRSFRLPLENDQPFTVEQRSRPD